ncbi:uncharacterized protein Triagg1_3298 [Trichoderma aggressivum f. europaeum]|uniref:Heterokaryon incompatibility domain-containing protein n=1 Tax=Trichoderma aggressivum f. europaeum TaxID=173218 RepID=A0AAE1IFM4_9HYPO|nr:hypothetical protein Triagg1_3298 [Trichoderma aggressivum f. europaeum]
MEEFRIDAKLLSSLQEASQEDLQALAEVHAALSDDDQIELYIYICFLIFRKSHNTQSLEQALKRAGEWVSATATTHPDYNRRCSILNKAVVCGFRNPAAEEGIEAVTNLNSEAIKLVTDFHRTGRFEYLNGAIRSMDLAISKAGKHRTSSMLSNFGNMLSMRYKQTASMGDLDRAVSITSEAVDATPTNHPKRAAYLIDLVHMLSMRYKHTASMDDLNRAVRIARVAVDATPSNHPGRAGRLSNLGNMLSMRYKQTASMNDLTRAVSIAKEAIAATPSNHPGLHVRLSNLQDMLRKRSEQIRPIDANPAASIAVNRHVRLLGTPETTGERRKSMKDLQITQMRNVYDVLRLISGAPADDVATGKYDSEGWDVDSEKSDKGADFEETDWERKPDQLDAIESEAENMDWDGNTVETTQSLTFDHDLRSGGTRPSTVLTSHPGMKGQRPRQEPIIPEAGELEIRNRREAEVTNAESLLNSCPLAEEETEEQQHVTDDCDVSTTYSVDTLSDEPRLRYLQVFAEQLDKDMKQTSDQFCFSSIEAEYLAPMLREFAWKLHSESSTPFQWEASVIIHKKLKNIIQLLVPRPLDCDAIGSQDGESSSSEGEDQDEFSCREIFRKSKTTVMQWVYDVGTSPYAGEELALPTEDGSVRDDIEHDEHGSKEPLLWQAHSLEILPQLLDYEQFIRVSDAYQWLLTKIRQHGLLTFQAPNAMLEIGTKIRNHLRAQEPLRKMSSRRPLSMVKMTFYFDWNLDRSMRDTRSSPQCEDALGRMVCLTGSWNEAQATTVQDYVDQTWPRSGDLMTLMQTLLATPEGQECSYQVHEPISSRHESGAGAARLTACVQSPSVCCISVTGSLYFVSEIGEQIGWLASVLQSSSDHDGPVACTPGVNDLQVHIQDEGPHGPIVVGSCNLSLNLETADISELSPGLCWGRLFYNPVLVRGYPILQRTQPNTGLEMSLANMAAIIGSQHVVQWGERMIIKGFNMLMIATLAAADIIVWHLLVSEHPEERISYIDPRLATLDSGAAKGISLRMLEERRHVIGWCSRVTDLCGDATANLNIKSSGLREPPASIVIDRLYIEAKADFGAGLNMSFNQKEKPFWLMRENDYPSLLKWVGIQPIVFYDVADRRAWLTDGASALLHLVRVSLYLDENDPESVYDWVFDATQLKDKWHGFTGRQAALKTLKSWDNLSLNVYVVGKQRRSEGGFETEYATLETRVKKMLHSIEILVDKQAMSSSQDGIRIPQTWDIRRDIIGFDIQDIIDPCSAIRSRVKHLDSWGHGWVDLIPSIGTTTIFGRGFGDLISPEEPHTLCSEWKSVPKGKDLMAASVSTLQMLYKQRLLREEPGLGPGELTSKIVWVSQHHQFKSCECLQRSASNTEDGNSHTASVQFLVAKKSLMSRLVLRGSTPVDVMALDGKGAVVFGHNPFLSRKSEGKFTAEQQDEDLDTASSVELSSRGTLPFSLVSPATSESIKSAGSTTITSPSLKASPSVEIRGEASSRSGENEKSDKKGKGWMSFMKFSR